MPEGAPLARGSHKQKIFNDALDYLKFLEILISSGSAVIFISSLTSSRAGASRNNCRGRRLVKLKKCHSNHRSFSLFLICLR